MSRSIPFSSTSLTLEQRLANLEAMVNKGVIQQTGADALVAKAGGGQSGATAITRTLNRFATVTTAADSSVLPQSSDGLEIVVINAGAASMNVFPSPGDSINALAVNAAFAVGNGKTAIFYCVSQGVWHTLLTA